MNIYFVALQDEQRQVEMGFGRNSFGYAPPDHDTTGQNPPAVVFCQSVDRQVRAAEWLATRYPGKLFVTGIIQGGYMAPAAPTTAYRISQDGVFPA